MAQQNDEDLDTADEPDLDEPDLDDDLDDDLDEADDANDLEIDNLDAGATVVDVDKPASATSESRDDTATDDTATKDTATKDDEDDVVLELDEELHPDDVEEPLDVLLKERTAAATLEDDEEEVEEEEVEADDRGEVPARIVPRRPGEFLCTSCFLVLPRNQLADEKRMLCRDCA
ncbi:MAG: DUF4193 family protein [Acidimicrobiia bacterium]